MSLMKTVTKMAIGFAMAKGMEAVQRRGGLGAVMDGLQAGEPRKGDGLGGLGGLLGQLGAAGAAGGAPGGLADILGQLTTAPGGKDAAGGLAGLGGLLGGLAQARGGSGASDLEALLSQGNPVDEPDEEDIARLMLRAMIQAARSDGDIDATEKARMLKVFKQGPQADMVAVQAILQEPVDAERLAADTPKGLETQVYTMSLNAIDPDNQGEARFLHSLASGLGLDEATVNAIHDGLGVQRLYS